MLSHSVEGRASPANPELAKGEYGRARKKNGYSNNFVGMLPTGFIPVVAMMGETVVDHPIMVPRG